MYNKRVLKTAVDKLDKAKAPAKSKDIIVDPMGQWKFPGQPTRIPSNEITMKGVNYPVVGVPNKGEPKKMMPGQYYTFNDADYVDEYPVKARRGGRIKKEGGPINPPNPNDPYYESKKIAYDRYVQILNQPGGEAWIAEKEYNRLLTCTPSERKNTPEVVNTNPNGLIEGPHPDQNTDPTLKHVATYNVKSVVDPKNPHGATTTVEKYYYERIPEETIKLTPKPITEQNLQDAFASKEPGMATIKQYYAGPRNMFGNVPKRKRDEAEWREVQVPADSKQAELWQERLEWSKKNNPDTPLQNFSIEAVNPIKKKGGQGLVHAQKGGSQIYKYADRPEASYKKDAKGNWLISLPSTKGEYVPIKDPTGKRAGELNEKAKPLTFKMPDIVSAEEKYHDGPLQSADWLWTLPIALPAAAQAAGAVGAMSLPGMASIPGATVGNAVNSMFIANSLFNTPENAKDWYDVSQGNKNWQDAALGSAEIAAGLYGSGAGWRSLVDDAAKLRAPRIAPIQPPVKSEKERVLDHLNQMGLLPQKPVKSYGSMIGNQADWDNYIRHVYEGTDPIYMKSVKNSNLANGYYLPDFNAGLNRGGRSLRPDNGQTGLFNIPAENLSDFTPAKRWEIFDTPISKNKKGGATKKSKSKYSRSLAATNYLFAESHLFKKPRKKAIYHPQGAYFEDGGQQNQNNMEDYIEVDSDELTPELIQQYANGGYIIEDMSVPSLNRNQYAKGGVKDLDPETMAKYLAELKYMENNIKAGYKNGKWYPHGSPEGGTDTIAYGHKLNPGDKHFYSGISNAQAEALQKQDVLAKQSGAKSFVDKKYGTGTFDKLPQDAQMLLVDYHYNAGISKFPNFVEGVVKGDKSKMYKEYERGYSGGKLTKRNEWSKNVIDNLNYNQEPQVQQEIPQDPNLIVPAANVQDNTYVAPMYLPTLPATTIGHFMEGGYLPKAQDGITNKILSGTNKVLNYLPIVAGMPTFTEMTRKGKKSKAIDYDKILSSPNGYAKMQDMLTGLSDETIDGMFFNLPEEKRQELKNIKNQARAAKQEGVQTQHYDAEGNLVNQFTTTPFEDFEQTIDPETGEASVTYNPQSKEAGFIKETLNEEGKVNKDYTVNYSEVEASSNKRKNRMLKTLAEKAVAAGKVFKEDRKGRKYFDVANSEAPTDYTERGLRNFMKRVEEQRVSTLREKNDQAAYAKAKEAYANGKMSSQEFDNQFRDGDWGRFDVNWEATPEEQKQLEDSWYGPKDPAGRRKWLMDPTNAAKVAQLTAAGVSLAPAAIMAAPGILAGLETFGSTAVGGLATDIGAAYGLYEASTENIPNAIKEFQRGNYGSAAFEGLIGAVNVLPVGLAVRNGLGAITDLAKDARQASKIVQIDGLRNTDDGERVIREFTTNGLPESNVNAATQESADIVDDGSRINREAFLADREAREAREADGWTEMPDMSDDDYAYVENRYTELEDKLDQFDQRMADGKSLTPDEQAEHQAALEEYNDIGNWLNGSSHETRNAAESVVSNEAATAATGRPTREELEQRYDELRQESIDYSNRRSAGEEITPEETARFEQSQIERSQILDDLTNNYPAPTYEDNIPPYPEFPDVTRPEEGYYDYDNEEGSLWDSLDESDWDANEPDTSQEIFTGNNTPESTLNTSIEAEAARRDLQTIQDDLNTRMYDSNTTDAQIRELQNSRAEQRAIVDSHRTEPLTRQEEITRELEDNQIELRITAGTGGSNNGSLTSLLEERNQLQAEFNSLQTNYSAAQNNAASIMSLRQQSAGSYSSPADYVANVMADVRQGHIDPLTHVTNLEEDINFIETRLDEIRSLPYQTPEVRNEYLELSGLKGALKDEIGSIQTFEESITSPFKSLTGSVSARKFSDETMQVLSKVDNGRYGTYGKEYLSDDLTKVTTPQELEEVLKKYEHNKGLTPEASDEIRAAFIKDVRASKTLDKGTQKYLVDEAKRLHKVPVGTKYQGSQKTIDQIEDLFADPEFDLDEIAPILEKYGYAPEDVENLFNNFANSEEVQRLAGNQLYDDVTYFKKYGKLNPNARVIDIKNGRFTGEMTGTAKILESNASDASKDIVLKNMRGETGARTSGEYSFTNTVDNDFRLITKSHTVKTEDLDDNINAYAEVLAGMQESVAKRRLQAEMEDMLSTKWLRTEYAAELRAEGLSANQIEHISIISTGGDYGRGTVHMVNKDGKIIGSLSAYDNNNLHMGSADRANWTQGMTIGQTGVGHQFHPYNLKHSQFNDWDEARNYLITDRGFTPEAADAHVFNLQENINNRYGEGLYRGTHHGIKNTRGPLATEAHFATTSLPDLITRNPISRKRAENFWDSLTRKFNDALVPKAQRYDDPSGNREKQYIIMRKKGGNFGKLHKFIR
jgi:hypothetical protein